jgi:hypothetical protein
VPRTSAFFTGDYLLGRPMPAEALARLARAGRAPAAEMAAPPVAAE